MKKRVLIISYYWPPSAGSGVQRWLKFSKFLPEHGYEPHVYTPLNPSFDLRDEELLADVSDQVVVVKRKITEPYALFKLFGGKKKGNTGLVNSDKKKSKFDQWSSWIRGNLFIPDPRVFWVKPSVKFLSQYVKEHRIDVVITTGPPHSMHLIGQGVKERTGIRWVVDMRDPFSKLDFLDTYSITDKNKKKYAKMEQDILNQCDHVLATSSSMPELLMPFDKNKFTCITNGFDPDDFPEKPASINREQFVVYHAGLLNSVRNPVQLWQAIRELLSENPDWASSWKMLSEPVPNQ